MRAPQLWGLATVVLLLLGVALVFWEYLSWRVVGGLWSLTWTKWATPGCLILATLTMGV
jgi:hypothetical protein